MKLPTATEATRSSLKNAVPKPFKASPELVKVIQDAIDQGHFSATYEGPNLLQIQAELTRLGYTANLVQTGMNEQGLKIAWNSQDRY